MTSHLPLCQGLDCPADPCDEAQIWIEMHHVESCCQGCDGANLRVDSWLPLPIGRVVPLPSSATKPTTEESNEHLHWKTMVPLQSEQVCRYLPSLSPIKVSWRIEKVKTA